MTKKTNLLSIGDISKLTKASIQSLRYYEQINLLKPTYVSPETGYRYYSYDQKCLIEVIQICLELDIPLKKLTEFMGDDKTINFYDILIHGKEIAEKKLFAIQKGLNFIEALKNNVDAADQGGQKFYTREMPKSYFCTVPIEGEIQDLNPYEIVQAVLRLNYDIDDYAEMFHFGLVDIGIMSMYSPQNVRHFMFTRLPKHIKKAGIKIIPAGTYLCTQSEDKQIENAPQVFRDYIKDANSFIVIETDIFTKKYKTNKLVHEMRLLLTDNGSEGQPLHYF